MLGKQNQENGTKQETGPPVEDGPTEERYSYEETEQELRGFRCQHWRVARRFLYIHHRTVKETM